MRRALLTIALLAIASLAALAAASQYGNFEIVRRAKLALLDLTACRCQESGKGGAAVPISLRDASDRLGPPAGGQTFSLAVADIDADGRDDILIGGHGRAPRLHLNRGDTFADESRSLRSFYGNYDSHGHTLADLDSDGDLDIAVAAGGEDGVGAGSPNMLLVNDTTGGSVAFRRQSVTQDFARPQSRTRTFMPLSGRSGVVDLYMTALLREGYPNAVLRNRSGAAMRLEADNSHPLSASLNDRGRGLLADFDGDGSIDYLAVTGNIATLYPRGDLAAAGIDLATRVATASAIDFNNDGALDLFLGRYSPPRANDLFAATPSALIFALHNNRAGDEDRMSFQTASNEIRIDLAQKVRLGDSGAPQDATDIFIGAAQHNPQKRSFSVSKDAAIGTAPQAKVAGTHIWYDEAEDLWHLLWRHRDAMTVLKGSIVGADIEALAGSELEFKQQRTTRDLVLLNDGTGKFTRLCSPGLEHREVSAASTVADFDNDGWLDIALLRRPEHGGGNGAIHILKNIGGNRVSAQHIPPRPQDKLKSGDLIAHGFLNGDRRPDLIVTNGYGQMPGNDGAPRLLLSEETNHDALLVHLEGDENNRRGIGATLTLRDARGAIIGHRVQGLNTNISQSSLAIHFGLGTAEAPYELSIVWPDGAHSTHTFNGGGRHTLLRD